jgi:glycosyltransferase involved in cell wall biosynthesis
MAIRRRKLVPRVDRGPLRVMFVITSMPVGGAETLLVNLIRRLDRDRFLPSLCCLKALGPLGEILQHEIPAFSELTTGKGDLRVLPRLVRLLRRERIDAVITVGAGDKMFWGRIAARIAGLPVVGCAIHSTGWPDAIGRINRSRLLVRWTDAFIGVASAHGKHLVEVEGFPREKVHIIPNGVDTQRFRPSKAGESLRRELGIAATAPVVGIVAALRPEKDHALFLQTAATVRGQLPGAQFIIVGDGDLRGELEQRATQLGIREAVHFLGNRGDIPEVLNALDLFVLTSKMEANPVSIL